MNAPHPAPHERVAFAFLPPPASLREKLEQAARDGALRFDASLYIPAELPGEILSEENSAPHHDHSHEHDDDDSVHDNDACAHNNDAIPYDDDDDGDDTSDDDYVEPAGRTANVSFDSSKLTEEMFISGMLRYLGKNPKSEDADYFRRLVRFLRPGILEEFSTAALVKMRTGDFDMALEIAHILAGLFPGAEAILHLKTVILQERARAIEKTGHEELARAANEEAERAEKREKAGAFYAAIRSLIEGGRGKEALPQIREQLEQRPKSWRLWFLLGWTLRSLRRWEEGREALQKTLELGGEHSDARNELAICHLELGQFREARRELEKALRAEPGNTKIISNLGVIALREGNIDEAERFFRSVLEFDSRDPLALQYFTTKGGASHDLRH
jgi:Flp pilus assembly protein TadD